MKTTHATAIVALFMMFFAGSVPATTVTVNYNDLWWDPNESGWGVNVAQQGSTLFLTFFIYGADSKPTWVTGQLSKTGYNMVGEPIFTGDIIVTTGPYYGGLDAVNTRQIPRVWVPVCASDRDEHQKRQSCRRKFSARHAFLFSASLIPRHVVCQGDGLHLPQLQHSRSPIGGVYAAAV